MKKIINRFLSILILCSLLASLLSACAKPEVSIPSSMTIDTEKIVETTVETILKSNTEPEDSTVPDSSEIWKEYLGDVETFVDALVTNQIGYFYDVFPAYVRLSNGTEISGIAYSDYSKCYVNDDETKGCYLAGFIPYCGELEISSEEFDSGLEIYNLDYQDEVVSFALAYKSDPFTDHCVVYGKYVQYGVDESGSLYYTESSYDKNIVNESIGSLYSYDQQRYLYDLEQGNYTGIAGASLSSAIDYKELETEINRILEKQDFNFSTVKIETYAYYAQEAVQSFFLSMQEENFLGYDVDYLADITSKLDPMECYRITNDGMMVLKLEEGNEASSLCKWIVGSVCVVVAAVGMVGSVVFVECPPLSAAAGALSGVAVEIFMQVVLESKSLDSIKWSRVALSAATGAVSGYLGPYVLAQYGGKFAAYFIVDSIIDGFLGAAEKAILTWMDGGDATAIAKSFGIGFALGFGLSAAFKGIGVLCEKLASKMAPALEKVARKVAPKLTRNVSDSIEKGANALSGLKKVADDSPFHSIYIANKMKVKQGVKLRNDGSDELLDKSIRSLKKTDIMNADGDIISKQTLREVAAKANDGDIIGYFYLDGETVNIIKKNSAIGVVFDSSKYQSVCFPTEFNPNRKETFLEAAKLLKESWLNDPSLMPESIAVTIKNSGKELEDISANDLKTIIQKSDFVLHENLDMKTVTLVDRSVHDKALGGISHLGGFAVAKYIKNQIGKSYFDRFIAAAASVAAETVT